MEPVWLRGPNVMKEIRKPLTGDLILLFLPLDPSEDCINHFNIENQSYAKCLQWNQNHIINLESSMGLVNACMPFVKTALREVTLIYGFEMELWKAEFLAEFHVACSEFISTWELCKIKSMKILMDQYWRGCFALKNCFHGSLELQGKHLVLFSAQKLFGIFITKVFKKLYFDELLQITLR